MKRVTIFMNGSNVDGKAIMTTSSFEDFLLAASKKIGIEVKKMFTAQGGEIDELDLIRDNDILFVSGGEDFIRLNNENARSLPNAAPQEQELIHRTCDVGAVSFNEVRYSRFFVDKTLIIKEILSRNSKVILLTTPPRFGKTINLSTIDEFVGKKLLVDGTPYVPKDNPFEGTKIWGMLDVRKYFRRYVTIKITFSGSPTNFTSAEKCLRMALSQSYIKHSYLLQSEKLNPELKSQCKYWCYPETISKDTPEHTHSLENGLFWLKKSLEAHHGPDVEYVVLVDEFDQLISNGMFCVEEDDLERIIRERDSILQIIKHDAENILFTVITGVADITSTSGSLINNEQRYSFLQNDYFYKFFGLLESEFEDLISRNKTEADFSNKMRDYYNGYIYQKNRIYNIWSVVNALHVNKIENFFSRKDLIIKMTPVLRDNHMETNMKMLLSGRTVFHADLLWTCFHAKNLATLARYCSRSAGDMMMDECVLLSILFQLGYLTCQNDGLMIPNIAIMNTLKNLYYSYFQESPYHINLNELKACADSFPIVHEFEKKELNIEQFCQNLKKVLSFKTRVPLNHQVIHSVLFMVIMMTQQCWSIISFECPVSETSHCNRCDIVLYLRCFLIIIEIKFKKTVEQAMQQIVNRSYADVLKNSTIVENPNNVLHIVRFGIAINEVTNTDMQMDIVDERTNLVVKSISASF